MGLTARVAALADRAFLPFARFSLFLVYFWFGILKILDTSPANPLVEQLQHKTLPFLTFHQFIIFFSFFEMLIGLCFLVPKLNKAALILLVPHMVTTFMPLVFLPAVTWQKFLTPSLEGQYILKNFVILALATGMLARMKLSVNR